MKYYVLITVNCFDNSENITASVATNVTAHGVYTTQWIDLPFYKAVN